MTPEDTARKMAEELARKFDDSTLLIHELSNLILTSLHLTEMVAVVEAAREMLDAIDNAPEEMSTSEARMAFAALDAARGDK